VQINGQIVTRTEFCVDETVTLICQLDSTEYEWTLPTQQSEIINVSLASPITRLGDFTAKYMDSNLSTLDFFPSLNHNGQMVFCTDGIMSSQVLQLKVGRKYFNLEERMAKQSNKQRECRVKLTIESL